MWVCLCGVWRLEVNLKCWPLPVSTLLFGAGSLPKPDDHWLARLADQWAQGIPLSTAMQHRMTGMCHYIRVFTRVLEIKHKSWLVYNNHFTNWAVSPCLLCSLWSSAQLYDALCSASRLSGFPQWEASWRDREGERCRSDGQAGERYLQTSVWQWLWSSTGRKAPDPSTVLFAPW